MFAFGQDVVQQSLTGVPAAILGGGMFIIFAHLEK